MTERHYIQKYQWFSKANRGPSMTQIKKSNPKGAPEASNYIVVKTTIHQPIIYGVTTHHSIARNESIDLKHNYSKRNPIKGLATYCYLSITSTKTYIFDPMLWKNVYIYNIIFFTPENYFVKRCMSTSIILFFSGHRTILVRGIPLQHSWTI